MAGGMGRRTGVPLSERVAGGLPGPAEDCPARHCWVSGGVDDVGVKRPGLLVEWRSSPLGWEGRVIYAVKLRPDTWAVVEEWLPESLLTPR